MTDSVLHGLHSEDSCTHHFKEDNWEQYHLDQKIGVQQANHEDQHNEPARVTGCRVVGHTTRRITSRGRLIRLKVNLFKFPFQGNLAQSTGRRNRSFLNRITLHA